MLDVILDYIVFNTLSGPSTFFIIFNVRIHLRLKTNEFSDRDATSFVFEFSNDFFIDIAIIWLALRIVAIIEHVFVFPKVLVYVLGFYFVG